jgi:hypothetical protein
MQTEILMEPEILTEKRLRSFSLYVDFAAAGRARWATSQIASLAGVHWKASTEMWNLDSLVASEPIRKMVAQDAADADVLVIAMTSLERRELELVEWLESLAEGKTNRTASGLFIGLLGDERQPAGELDWTVKQFLRCAQLTDRDFIWHWMEQGVMNSNDWLAASMESLLARKQPSRDAAFLQEAVLGAC